MSNKTELFKIAAFPLDQMMASPFNKFTLILHPPYNKDKVSMVLQPNVIEYNNPENNKPIFEDDNIRILSDMVIDRSESLSFEFDYDKNNQIYFFKKKENDNNQYEYCILVKLLSSGSQLVNGQEWPCYEFIATDETETAPVYTPST